MNAALPYLSHRWFAPSLVVLCAVLGPWMSTDSTLTWLLAGLLFVALGLPHGAVDHITYHHALGRTERSAPWRFVLPYLLGLAAFTALFLVAPTAATWAFLALAAWHFGQSHVEVRTHEVLDRVRGFALGAVLLGTLLGTQQVSSMEVLCVWLTEAQATHLLVTLEAGTAWMKLIWTVAAALAWNRAPNAKRMSIRLLARGGMGRGHVDARVFRGAALGVHGVLLPGTCRRFLARRIPAPPKRHQGLLDLLHPRGAVYPDCPGRTAPHRVGRLHRLD